MSLFAAQLFRATLLSAEQAQALHVNVGAVLNPPTTTQLAAVDLLVSRPCTRMVTVVESDYRLLQGRYAMASEAPDPTLVYDTYTAPELWPDLCQSLRNVRSLALETLSSLD
jgi:hypothetical protein